MHKHIFVCAAVLIINAGFIMDGQAKDEPSAQSQTIELHQCKDEGLEISFLCNPSWALEVEEDVILVVISEEPAVTMTVARQKTPKRFNEQLTEDMLKGLGQYAEGFASLPLVVDGSEAVEVVGSSVGYPDIRLKDYYILKSPYLYSVLFSVDPASKAFEYDELFKKVIDSFRFVF